MFKRLTPLNGMLRTKWFLQKRANTWKGFTHYDNNYNVEIQYCVFLICCI